MILVPIKTGNGLNSREHWRARADRVKRERTTTYWRIVTHAKPPIPCVVNLCRIAPSSGLDDDNLPGSLKAVRDEIAQWLGVDDRHDHIVKYRYSQERGPWGVRIEFEPARAVLGVE